MFIFFSTLFHNYVDLTMTNVRNIAITIFILASGCKVLITYLKLRLFIG
jgi:hypothetical protein